MEAGGEIATGRIAVLDACTTRSPSADCTTAVCSSGS